MNVFENGFPISSTKQISCCVTVEFKEPSECLVVRAEPSSTTPFIKARKRERKAGGGNVVVLMVTIFFCLLGFWLRPEQRTFLTPSSCVLYGTLEAEFVLFLVGFKPRERSIIKKTVFRKQNREVVLDCGDMVF